ncbi:hypothetical protein PMAYCL1PPCAC_18741, partial [Pristionchus mayeri]
LRMAKRGRPKKLEVPLVEQEVDSKETCCSCNEMSTNAMVNCANKECSIERYHLKCIQMEEGPPDGVDWFCEICRPHHTHVPNQYDYDRKREGRVKRGVVLKREEELKKEKEKM